MPHYKLLTAGESSPKLAKFQGLETAILYLAPHAMADGKTNLCPESHGCRVHCLVKQGRGTQTGIRHARIKRTRLFLKHPDAFEHMLHYDIEHVRLRAARRGVPAVVRLNGFSDLDWRHIYLYHPTVGFWEYTKRLDLARAFLHKEFPSNVLRVTYSRNEKHGDAQALELAEAGAVVTVVFRTRRHAPLPRTWHGKPVHDGDINDARWNDAPGTIVGLRAKGTAFYDRTGFVVEGVES